MFAVSPDVLVVGATGMLGRWLVPELTRRGRVVAAVLRNAGARAEEYRAWVKALGGEPERLHVLEGDLDAPRFGWKPGQEEALGQVRDVYHLGARFAWNLSADEARRTNVEGTRAVVELASRLPALRRLVLIGGYRIGPRYGAAGERVPAPEKSLSASGSYEASKGLAHRVGLETAARLRVPVTTVHPSSVIGDSRTGMTVQLLGLGATMKRIHDGAMPVLLGSPQTFVPVLAVDYMASFLAGVPELPEAEGGEYTLLDPDTPPLHDLVRWAAARSGRRAPSFSLPVSWVRWLPERLLGASTEELDFLDTARYPVEPALALARRMGLVMPPVRDVIERWFDYLRGVDFSPDVHRALSAAVRPAARGARPD
ncbi:SDR family oxidoreductase [Vitiosangium sp. GDMCC 1.1324]|uniref:SDR family oxidoreductase n=1 Tax=Vitiosangium sp. (strain GDMCC 1.1324) TaxID=2138576 RepID=UPI000D3D0B63|nr:SDR family oxidoreductase [Vitiosangium sp. GDMCC 1.1324]PTL83231.1 NAD-dependent epimerase [Vitiosangium sp. GDMCC 1.1324]